jgi:hypothetical protein
LAWCNPVCWVLTAKTDSCDIMYHTSSIQSQWQTCSRCLNEASSKRTYSSHANAEFENEAVYNRCILLTACLMYSLLFDKCNLSQLTAINADIRLLNSLSFAPLQIGFSTPTTVCYTGRRLSIILTHSPSAMMQNDKTAYRQSRGTRGDVFRCSVKSGH